MGLVFLSHVDKQYFQNICFCLDSNFCKYTNIASKTFLFVSSTECCRKCCTLFWLLLSIQLYLQGLSVDIIYAFGQVCIWWRLESITAVRFGKLKFIFTSIVKVNNKKARYVFRNLSSFYKLTNDQAMLGVKKKCNLDIILLVNSNYGIIIYLVLSFLSRL